ncbi:MAG: Puromycin-sensitive aminopeptidase [Parcubacteria group bacterium GW2011_GWA2_45_30]|nr:MAG: Puromycin-sensitive aminopeptidase [Parcubacteria group bacterium GW2011_GWA2_45_30]
MAKRKRSQSRWVIFVRNKKNSSGNISLFLLKDRFFMDGTLLEKYRHNDTSITILTKYNPIPTRHIMNTSELQIENVTHDTLDSIEGATHRDWIKITGRTGFYRVAYSNDLFSRILDAMRNGEIINPKDRIGLIDDTVALARAGLYKTSEALELLNTCRDEREYAVWATIISALNEIRGIVPNLGALLAFQEFAQNVLRPALSRVGWDKKIGEPDLHGMLRPMLITALGRFEDSPTINEAFEQFGKAHAGFEISADIRGAVYEIVAIYGNSAVLDRLLALYEHAGDDQEKKRILNALAGAGCNDESLIERVLEFLMSDKVLTSDAPLVIERMGAHNKPGMIAWNFIKTNWQDVVARFHGDGVGKLLPRAIEGLVGSFNHEGMVLEAEEFLGAHPLEGGKNAFTRALEKARSNVSWKKRALDDFYD